MAYQNVSFSAGETLTATKMNQMAANDAAFHDGTGIAAGAITAGKIDFTTFSTTEKAVGTWIDGKTIYRKTVDFGTLPNTALKQVRHNISSLDTIVNIQGIAHRSANNESFQIGNAANPLSGLAASIAITVNDSTINITTGSNRTNMTAYITLYYTKN